MEEFKAYWGKYLSGAIIGALLVVILGFAVGPLTTNGSAAALASAAASNRDVAFCVAKGQRSISSGDVSATTNHRERIELARASLADLLPDQKVSDTVVSRCSQAFPGEAAGGDDQFWFDGGLRREDR